jgi:anti-sigma-K factor RskA
MTRDEKLAIVGEYVLGLLDGADRQAFEAQLATDPELQGMAQQLAERMHALDATAEAGPGDPALWRRIEGRLDAPADAAPADVVAIRPARRRALPLSQWASIAASLVIAAGLGFFAGTSEQTPAQPTVIAALLDANLSPGAIIEAYADDSVMVVTLEDFVVPEGQVLQVWTLPDAETGPVSLGTLATAQRARLAGPKLPVPKVGQLYEITLEPAPGSPTGRPTGPILVKGFAKPPV